MKLTTRQGFCLTTAFLLGNVLSGIGGMNSGTKTGYLSVFFSYGIFLLFILLYHRVLTKNGALGFFQLTKHLFGTRGQKLVLVVVAVSAFISALFSVSNYLEFIAVSTYNKTPLSLCLVLVLVLILYLCLSQEKAMGRYAEIVLPIVLVALAILFGFGIRQWDLNNLNSAFPIIPILKQGAALYLGPFSEIIFIYILSDCLNNPKSITKIAVISGGLVTVIFSLMYLFNLLILGENLLTVLQFPTFVSASVVRIGTIIEKAETLITFSYSFCDILYSGVCLLVCIKAISHLIPTGEKAKKITALVAVILIGLIWLVLKNTVTIHTLYPMVTLSLLPITVGLPILMLLFSLGKRKKPH